MEEALDTELADDIFDTEPPVEEFEEQPQPPFDLGEGEDE